MTKVLHIIQALSMGGAARALVVCAARCMERRGGMHTVAGLEPASPAHSLDFARNAGLEVLDAPSLDKLRAAMEASDIVQVHYWNSPAMTALLRQDLPAMRLVVKFNVGGAHAPHVITREVVDLADMVQATGPFAADLPVFDALDPEERADKVWMIPGAADFSRLDGFAPRPHAGYVVSYLGTVDFVKMHPEYVALSHAVRVPEATFLVRGGGTAHDTLLRQIQARGIQERFDIKKEKEDIRDVLAITDVFGYPLCQDNYSSGELVLQEVAYAGIPAVVFRYGGAGRLVVDNFTGYVVRSAPEYRDAIEHLWQCPEDRLRLGRNAREYATQCYGDANSTTSTLAMYDRLLTRPKRVRRFGCPQGAGALDLVGSDAAAAQLLEEVGAAGCMQFVDSLGDAAPWFLASLCEADPALQLQADAAIGASTPVLAAVLLAYAARHAQDAPLQYWAGLVQMERGNAAAAAAAMLQSLRLGWDHWRVHWTLGRAAWAMGETDMAREALERVLQQAPHFQEAQELLAAILGENEGPASLPQLRQRRELFLALGNLERATAAALAALAATPDPGDFEAFYNIGLTLHTQGALEQARAIYAQVCQDTRAPRSLRAWAHFKQGEALLDAGMPDQARPLFVLALDLKPDLAKAAILLVPAETPLRVRFGDAPACGPDSETLVQVHMPPLDAGLWAYHFSRRAPDEVRLTLPQAATPDDCATLAGLLHRWLAPGGTARVFGVPAFLDCSMFREAGLAATLQEDVLFLCHASTL